MDTPQKFITSVECCFGYGGLHLGLKRVIPNLQLLAACEIEAYACANMVAKMEAGFLDPAPIWTDLKTFPFLLFRDRVDLFIAGYPCQPFSAAGKRLGADDPRHLWPYLKEGIKRMRPFQCFFENVEGHISLGLREVLTDLVGLGYRVENRRQEPTWGIFSAAEVRASQMRKRVFILAQLDDSYRQRWGTSRPDGLQSRHSTSIASTSKQLANAESRIRLGRAPGRDGHSSQQGQAVADSVCQGREGSEQPAALHGHGNGEEAHGSAPELCGSRLGAEDVEHAGLQSQHESHDEACTDARGDARENAGRGCGGIFGEFPPGPDDFDAWQRILGINPFLAPALPKSSVCGVADGDSLRLDEHRVDRLRLCGNGVVPTTAAKAYYVLNQRMNG